jgi:hypothetical protein
MRKTLLAVMLLSPLSFGQTATTQDADALEAQYSTCEKHHIPADKCTPEIYQQLKAKDNAPFDPKTATVLQAVREYRSRLKNPDSMQLRTAYLTDDGAICLELGAQNGAGGMGVSRIVYVTSDWKGAKRPREHWLDEGGMGGSASADVQRDVGSGLVVNRWPGVCQKNKAFSASARRHEARNGCDGEGQSSTKAGQSVIPSLNRAGPRALRATGPRAARIEGFRAAP